MEVISRRKHLQIGHLHNRRRQHIHQLQSSLLGCIRSVLGLHIGWMVLRTERMVIYRRDRKVRRTQMMGSSSRVLRRTVLRTGKKEISRQNPMERHTETKEISRRNLKLTGHRKKQMGSWRRILWMVHRTAMKELDRRLALRTEMKELRN